MSKYTLHHTNPIWNDHHLLIINDDDDNENDNRNQQQQQLLQEIATPADNTDYLNLVDLPSNSSVLLLKSLIKNKPWIFSLIYIWMVFLFWIFL